MDIITRKEIGTIVTSKEGYKTEIIKVHEKGNKVDILIHDGHDTVINRKNFYDFKYGRIKSPYYMTEHIHDAEWKTIEGYENYAVSNVGYVKNIKTGRILKYQISRIGYCSNTISDSQNNRKSFSVHRLVAKYFVDNPHGHEEVNHINGIKSDNHAENLEWCTRSENIRHAHRMNLATPRRMYGTVNPRTKLTDDQVIEIYVSDESRNDLAKKYSVTVNCIRDIQVKQTWISVTDKYDSEQ